MAIFRKNDEKEVTPESHVEGNEVVIETPEGEKRVKMPEKKFA